MSLDSEPTNEQFSNKEAVLDLITGLDNLLSNSAVGIETESNFSVYVYKLRNTLGQIKDIVNANGEILSEQDKSELFVLIDRMMSNTKVGSYVEDVHAKEFKETAEHVQDHIIEVAEIYGINVERPNINDR